MLGRNFGQMLCKKLNGCKCVYICVFLDLYLCVFVSYDFFLCHDLPRAYYVKQNVFLL